MIGLRFRGLGGRITAKLSNARDRLFPKRAAKRKAAKTDNIINAKVDRVVLLDLDLATAYGEISAAKVSPALFFDRLLERTDAKIDELHGLSKASGGELSEADAAYLKNLVELREEIVSKRGDRPLKRN